MVKHSSSILKFHSERHHKYRITATTVVFPMQLCGVLITGAVLLAHPKSSLSHGKSLCNLYFVGNEASSSLVLHPCYVHNIVSNSISYIFILFVMLSYTQFFSIFILFIMLSYTQFLSIFILFIMLYTQNF